MTHPPWEPCEGGTTKESWTAERSPQLPESGTRPPQFSACADPGGELWQKQGGQTFQQNGGRHGARRVRTAGTMWEIDAANLEGAAAIVRPTGSREEANNTALENGSTNRR
jgi:hypothetical protein